MRPSTRVLKLIHQNHFNTNKEVNENTLNTNNDKKSVEKNSNISIIENDVTCKCNKIMLSENIWDNVIKWNFRKNTQSGFQWNVKTAKI